MDTDSTLNSFKQLVGTWTTEATHPLMPGVTVHGTAVVEWLEGQRFLIFRASTDHPDFPDSISIIGRVDHDRVDSVTKKLSANADAGPLHMQYYDERGVFRDNLTKVENEAWHWWRDAKGFSQRFTGAFADNGATIIGQSQLREDDVHWKDDLAIIYRRTSS